MELALIPVAAILLLLSGSLAPTRAAHGGSAAAALMRSLLGSGQHAARRSFGMAAASRSALPGNRAAVRSAEAGAVLALACGLAFAGARGSRRKLLRTRFGFADAAFLAVGPPPALR